MIRDRQGSPASAKTVACFCPFWTSLSAVQRSPRQAMCGVFWSRSVPYQIREEKEKPTFSVVSSTSAAVLLFRFRGGSSATEEDTSTPSSSSREGTFSPASLASLAPPKNVEDFVAFVRSMASA